MRPAKSEIMSIERVRHHFTGWHPHRHARVVVQQLVQRERQIPIGRPSNVGELAVRTVGVEQLAENLDAGAVAQQLTRREQVAPQRHAVLYGPVVVADFWKLLARHHIEGFPFGQPFGEPRLNLRAVVVLRPGCPVAAHPPVLAAFAGLEDFLDPPPVDDGEELFAHPARLSLTLDLVAIDDPAAIGIGASSGTPRHRAARLLPGGLDDLEGATPAFGTGTSAQVGLEPDPSATRCQPPVRRERHQALAIGAGDGARPEVAVNLVVHWFQPEKHLDTSAQLGARIRWPNL